MSVPNIRPTPVVLDVFVCNHFTVGNRFVESTVHISYAQALLYAAQRCFAFMENLVMLDHEKEYLLKYYAAEAYGDFLEAYAAHFGDRYVICPTALVLA